MEYQLSGLNKIELKKFVLIKKNQSKEQMLADEIYNYFGKQIAFPRLMFYIKNWGYHFTRENFEQSKKADIPVLPLFLSKFKKTKIVWK